MSLPTKLQEWVEKESERQGHGSDVHENEATWCPITPGAPELGKKIAFCPDPSFIAGAQAIYDHLTEMAPEFDEVAARERYDKIYSSYRSEADDAIELARWQHSHMSAQIAALKAKQEEASQKYVEEYHLRIGLEQNQHDLEKALEKAIAALKEISKVKPYNPFRTDPDIAREIIKELE